jgi:hypothetical protein
MFKKKFIYFCIFNYKRNSDIKNLPIINQQIKNNESGIWNNFKNLVDIKKIWNSIFTDEKQPASMYKNIGNLEDSLLFFGSKNHHHKIPVLWKEILEGALIEEMFKIFFDIFNDILENFGFHVDENEIAKEINDKNLIKKNLTLSEEEKNNFQNIINLLNISSNTNSVIYINGPAGIGKTSNIINELGNNNFTIFYINSSNILYGKYKSNNISKILSNIWNRALDVKSKGKKVVIIFDECESLIKKRNKKKLEENSIENTIINSRTDLEHALTVFFLYILAQKQVSVILISNPCYDAEGNLDISEEMNRRINYIYDMELPSLKNLIKLWRFYILSYNIKIIDENLESVIYFLSKISFEKKISIRTISSITSAIRGRSITLNELISLLN